MQSIYHSAYHNTNSCSEHNRGPLLEPDPEGELVSEHLVAGPGTTGLGRAQPEETTWSHLPVGPPPAGKVMGVGCIAYQAVGKRGVLGVRIPSSADWF